MLNHWHLLPYLMPLFVCILLFLVNFGEKRTVYMSFVAIVVPFLNSIFLIAAYFIDNIGPKNFELTTIHILNHHLRLSAYIDVLTLIILFLTGYLSLIVGKFSHTYLHREVGFQRYFATILLFVFGMQIVALAGTFDIFFAGWEIVGVSSFLLISFYRNRTRPSKNAFRIFSIYHLCDVGLLMSVVLAHKMLHEHATFVFIAGPEFHNFINNSMPMLNAFSILLLIAAVGKSGQFPVMNWPARAMEGPTPSSAIFYGALSIHCGVILLLRSYQLWQYSSIMHVMVGVIGALTFIFSTIIGKVQSNIKGQIAYSASAQIGIMFFELAFGLVELAMVHFFCHALYRCYQLLISPSIVVDHIKSLELSTEELVKIPKNYLFRRLRATAYCFALQEGMLEISERGGIFIVNIQMKLFIRKIFSHFATPILLAIVCSSIGYFVGHQTPQQLIAYGCAGMGLSLSINCLISLAHPNIIWLRLGLGIILILLAALLFMPQDYVGLSLYAISAIPFWFCGNYALKNTTNADLNQFNGFHQFNKWKTSLFILAFVTFNGLPFTTTFLGVDVLLDGLLSTGHVMLVIILASFTFFGLASARILSKVYFGYPRIQKY